MINQLNIDQKKYILEKRIGMWESNKIYLQSEIDNEKKIENIDQDKIDQLNINLSTINNNIEVLSTELKNLI